jgi:polysaccharide chain length determinant protein (PEP-CTERM system associated)
LSYLRGVWHKRWYAIAIAWLFSGAGWAFVANLPDKYESTARIYVDMDTMLSPLMKGLAVEMNLYQQIAVMQRTLLSRPNLEKVVLMTDMDLAVRNDEQKEALFISLRKRISIAQQGRGLNLYKISFEDTDPGQAKRVVQAILQIFVEGNIGASRKDMDATRRFIDDQLREYERQLNESESRLADFKRKNMGFLPGEGNFYSELEQKRAKVATTEALLREAKSVNGVLRNQVQTIPQFLEVASGNDFAGGGASGPGPGPGTDTQLRIMEMEAAIDSLLTRYTEKHPDVVVAKKRLASLQNSFEKEQEKEMSFLGSEGTDNATPQTIKVPNPVYEKLKVQLVQAEAGMAAIISRLENEKKQVEKWLQLANLVPQVEVELARLTRDSTLVKKNYDQLRSRKESAKMARELETKAQKVQFRIIDPPKIPVKPTGPNRPLFMSVVLLAGMVGGLAFAFLLSQINTAISTVDALRSKFSFPVLGSITAITSLQERRRRLRELSGFAVMGASLLFAYLGLMAIQHFGADTIVDGVKQLGII